MEALEKALYCWEDALTAFSSSFGNGTLALPSAADAAFTQDVQELLDMGYQVQNHAELLFIDQVTISVLSVLYFPFRFITQINLTYLWCYFIIENGKMAVYYRIFYKYLIILILQYTIKIILSIIDAILLVAVESPEIYFVVENKICLL